MSKDHYGQVMMSLEVDDVYFKHDFNGDIIEATVKFKPNKVCSKVQHEFKQVFQRDHKGPFIEVVNHEI